VIETMHREVRSGDGPFAAAVAVAVARGDGADPGDGLANVAAACELLRLIASCYPELSNEATSELARFNNTLALLTGELVLARAIENGRSASAEIGIAVASAAQTCAGSLAEAHAQEPDHLPSVEGHLDAIGVQAGAIGSLAARSGALLVGAEDSVEDLSEAAHHLMLAWQVGNEIRDVTTGDEVAWRPPGAGLRGGRVTLPLIHALELNPSLAELRLSSSSGSTRRLVSGIQATAAVDRAAEDVATQVGVAMTKIDASGLSRPEPLQALANLCVERLPQPA
jgi:geranylgeranyl pyrophosphate synthase